jgi:hypothetical protein
MQDQKALKSLDSSVRLDGKGQYEVGMLWSQEPVVLPNNRCMAERRFIYLEKRLKNDPDLCSRYSNVVNGYIEKGYARKLSLAETEMTSDRKNLTNLE